MSASGRKAKAALIQGPIRHQHNEHHAENNALEDAIMAAHGITCSVRVTQGEVKIRTKTFSDYILARAAIKGRVSQPIIRDGN